MKKLTSKCFRKNNFFVLYDSNDFPVCYFDNFEELSKHLNYPCFYLVRKFNECGNTINIIINNVGYKLFTTTELESF